MPDTFAFVCRRIALMVGPPSIDRSTSARVSTASGAWPAWASAFDSAMVKQAACAAAISSSGRSEEHTSELQSLMRISYAVFCLKKKKQKQRREHQELRQTRHIH